MTFEEWFKYEHGTYIMIGEVTYEDGEYSAFMVETLMRKAFEAGYKAHFDEMTEDT